MIMSLLPFIKGNKKQCSPLAGSMADMTYKELEQAATGGAAVLLPVSAIEEHGPHLPIGTNTFLTNRICLQIQRNLRLQEHHTVIAPPLFWGRNHSTGSFPGSFNLKSQTLNLLTMDILSDLMRWEFGRIILVNLHGEPHHNNTLIETVKQARSERINAFYLLPNQSLGQYHLTGSEEFLITYHMPAFIPPSPYVDLHAGTFETSWMMSVYPEYVNTSLIKTLQSTKTTAQESSVWSKGWDEVKRAFPLGYCGNPAKIEIKKAKDFEDKLVEQITNAILQ